MTRPVDVAKRPQHALQAYLDGLLQEVPEAFELPETAPEPAVVVEAVPAEPVLDEFQAAVLEEQVRDARRPVSEQPPLPKTALARAEALIHPDEPMPWAEPVAPQLSMPVLQQALRVAPALPVEPVAEVHLPVPVSVPVSVPAPMPVPTPAHHAEPAPPGGGMPGEEGPPVWAAEPFECLLFDVAGLTLAVPLVCLGSIYPLAGQELTPLFGQPEWFLGILPSHGGNLKVLDTARWVMPDRYRDDFRQGLQYVISVQGYEWGLAVHHVSRSLRLEPSEIKWRTQRGQRPWLAGTVIEHMCALLDVAALAELIASGAIKRQMQEAKEKTAAEAKAKADAQRAKKR